MYTLIVDKRSERSLKYKKYGYRYPEGRIQMSKI